MAAPSPDVRVACVQRSPLFQGLLSVQCGEIASLAHERHFAKQQTIFRQGDPQKFIFVLVSGRVKITETNNAGAEVILGIEEAGEVVGGLGLVPGTSHIRTAKAPERCHVLAWEAEEFQSLFGRYPVLALNSFHILSERMRVLEERFQELATQPVAPRLARALVRLVEQDENGIRKPSPIVLSHEELAQMTGMTSFTVSRLLCEWKQRGIIIIQRRSVAIKDLPSLRMVAKGTA